MTTGPSLAWSPDAAITATCGVPVEASVVVTQSWVPSSTPETRAADVPPPSRGTEPASVPLSVTRSTPAEPVTASSGVFAIVIPGRRPSSMAAWRLVRSPLVRVMSRTTLSTSLCESAST